MKCSTKCTTLQFGQNLTWKKNWQCILHAASLWLVRPDVLQHSTSTTYPGEAGATYHWLFHHNKCTLRVHVLYQVDVAHMCFIVQKSGNIYKETLRLALCTLLSYMSTYKVYIVQEVCSLKFPLEYNSKVYLVMFTIPLSQKWLTIYKSRYCGVRYFHYILSNCIATTYQIDIIISSYLLSTLETSV